MWGFIFIGFLTLAAIEAYPTDSKKLYLPSDLSKYDSQSIASIREGNQIGQSKPALQRSLDAIGGGYLNGRSLDGIGGGYLNGFHHVDLGMPNLDFMLPSDAASPLLAKRNQRKVDHLKKQQHRRGSFDSLLAGNGFGRNARSDSRFGNDASSYSKSASHTNVYGVISRSAGEEKSNHALFEALVRCMYYATHHSNVHQVSAAKLSNASLNRDGRGSAECGSHGSGATPLFSDGGGYMLPPMPLLH